MIESGHKWFVCSNGKIYDSYGQHVKHFPDVPEMLERLKQDGYVIAAASRYSDFDDLAS